MNIKSKSITQPCDGHEIKSDIKPLINLFELLLEWDMKDVQEKEEKRKEVSQKV
jgi:hypothetical protein